MNYASLMVVVLYALDDCCEPDDRTDFEYPRKALAAAFTSVPKQIAKGNKRVTKGY